MAPRASVVALPLGECVPVAREEPVVCIPVYGSQPFERCLRSVLEHTSPNVPILIGDDATPDGDIRALCDLVRGDLGSEHEIFCFRQEENVGFVRNVNCLFDMAAPGDVALLNSDCIVSAGWLEGLRSAAWSESTIATASALTNHGTILSVPRRNIPSPLSPHRRTFDECATTIRRRSPRLRPRIPTAVGHCTYVRRSAIELVGGLDTTFSPGYGEEVDFSQRCVLQGLAHVAADDVFVFHAGAGTFGPRQAALKKAHADILDRRYPYYEKAIAEARTAIGPLSRSLASARRAATQGFTVTIDGRYLGKHITGTQIHTLELVRGLVQVGGLRVRVVVPDEIGAEAYALLESLGVDLVSADERRTRRTTTDIVHRPYQVFRGDDLELLADLGERVVITQQDLIAYHNPGYFGDVDEWREHRTLTEVALAFADRVLFFSEYSRQAALREDLVDADNTDVVYLGAVHGVFDEVRGGEAEAAIPTLVDREFLLCLGTDFRHKNRVFALRLLEALQHRHGWTGSLVLAGPRVGRGSSRKEEAELLDNTPALADAVVVLGSVSEAQKRWLLAHAIAVVYPTVEEGFGLIPFEAASAGTPCIYACQTSLAETLPATGATIVPWSAAATADRVIRLLTDDDERRASVDATRDAAARFTWETTASKVVKAYERTLESTPRPGRNALVRTRTLGISRPVPAAMDAIPDNVQSFLTAVALRPWLRTPVFGTLELAFRAGHYARRARGRRNPAAASPQPRTKRPSGPRPPDERGMGHLA